jgi:hypothetical protein
MRFTFPPYKWLHLVGRPSLAAAIGLKAMQPGMAGTEARPTGFLSFWFLVFVLSS